MPASPLTRSDRESLRQRGLSTAEAERQFELLRRPPRYVELVRPCTPGDGIVRIDEGDVPGLLAAHDDAAAAGRFQKFVPASGAASRMFRELLHFQRGARREGPWPEIRAQARAGELMARTLVVFIEGLERFAFRFDLRAELSRRGEELDKLASAGVFQPILDALLDADGLDYDARPKGLIPFHAYAAGGRTPFEEHLIEAAATVRDASGDVRLHFTVSPEHQAGFEALLGRVGASHEARLGARFRVRWSVQKPSTDTLAVDDEGRPLRDPEGRLVFRPGGHGALIENLAAEDADLLLIKNIDNVQPDRLRDVVVRWKKTLGGYLVGVERGIGEFLGRLGEREPSPALLEEALRFVRSQLNVELDERLQPATYQCKRAFLIDRLHRPLRVCGVVRNTGEPGGGPFWVRGGDGRLSLQIVESAQVDPGDAGQQRIFTAATHFNPVDLACSVRGASGHPYDLTRFVDHDAVIVTRKSTAGVEIRVLERPGLWNGAMAGWNTVFVEVPIETFTPVKTVLDLLREEHRA